MNVTNFFENQLQVILPELFILLSVSTLLLGEFNISTEKDGCPVVVKPIAWIVVLVTFLAVLLVLNNSFDTTLLFNNLLIHDPLTNMVKAIMLLTTGACILVSFRYIREEKVHAYEYSLLMLFSIVGSMVIVSSYDLLTCISRN